MEYVKPLNEADANAPYIDGDASQDIEGSEVPAAAIEQPMREVVNVIKHFLGDEAPNGEDLVEVPVGLGRMFLCRHMPRLSSHGIPT